MVLANGEVAGLWYVGNTIYTVSCPVFLPPSLIRTSLPPPSPTVCGDYCQPQAGSGVQVLDLGTLLYVAHYTKH